MSRNPRPPAEYEVGYGKPPKHTRFKPGQSGNPKGRRKGAQSLRSILEEELRRPVTIMEGGKPFRTDMRRLMVRQNVAKAAKGDPRAWNAIIGLVQQEGLFGSVEEAEPTALPLSPEERAILDDILGQHAEEKNSPEGSC
jgi:hypothetical protein